MTNQSMFNEKWKRKSHANSFINEEGESNDSRSKNKYQNNSVPGSFTDSGRGGRGSERKVAPSQRMSTSEELGEANKLLETIQNDGGIKRGDTSSSDINQKVDDPRIKGGSYNKGSTALFLNATGIITGTSSKQENEEDDIYNEKFNRKIVFAQSKDGELSAEHASRQENRLCPSSWFTCPHERKCERMSWKLCFFCCCLPLCYPCYLSRILRKKSSKERELEVRDLEIGAASRSSKDCIISQHRFGQLSNNNSKHSSPRRKPGLHDLPDHNIDVVFAKSPVNQVVFDKLERCSGFHNLRTPRKNRLSKESNSKENNSYCSIHKSSPVMLRRSGTQVQVPLCNTEYSQEQHQPQPKDEQSSKVYDEDQISGPNHQDNDICLDEDNPLTTENKEVRSDAASLSHALQSSNNIQSSESGDINRDSEKYFSCDSLCDISTLSDKPYPSYKYYDSTNIKQKSRCQRFHSLPSNTGSVVSRPCNKYDNTLQNTDTKSQVLSSSVSSPSRYFSAMGSRASQNTLFGAGSLISEQIFVDTPREFSQGDTPRDIGQISYQEDTLRDSGQQSFQQDTPRDICHDSLLEETVSDSKAGISQDLHFNSGFRDENYSGSMSIRKTPPVNNGGVKSKLRRTSDINGVPHEIHGLLEKREDELNICEASSKPMKLAACEPVEQPGSKSNGEGLWMKLNHNSKQDDHLSNKIGEHCNTHNRTNTIQNTELEMTCDISPRIIIHNSEDSYLNCDNNNQKSENGVSKNQENYNFARRIRELSTAAQLEKLLDGSCNNSCNHLTNNSSGQSDHVTNNSCCQSDHVTNNSCNQVINSRSDHLTTNSLKALKDSCDVSKNVKKCVENCDTSNLSQVDSSEYSTASNQIRCARQRDYFATLEPPHSRKHEPSHSRQHEPPLSRQHEPPLSRQHELPLSRHHNECSIIVETASIKSEDIGQSKDSHSMSMHRFDNLHWNPKKIGSIKRKVENQSFIINFYQDTTDSDVCGDDSVFTTSPPSDDLPCMNTIIVAYCNSNQLNKIINQKNPGVLSFIDEYWHGYHPALLIRLHNFIDQDDKEESIKEECKSKLGDTKLGIKLSVLQHFTKSFKKSSSDELPSSHVTNNLETSKLTSTEKTGPSTSTTKEPVLSLGNSLQVNKEPHSLSTCKEPVTISTNSNRLEVNKEPHSLSTCKEPVTILSNSNRLEVNKEPNSLSTCKEHVTSLGNSLQVSKEPNTITKLPLSSVGSHFEDKKYEESFKKDSKNDSGVEKKESLEVTKSAQSSLENNISISKSSNNLLHPQILRASPWLKATSGEDKPILTESISNPSTTTNKVADQQINLATASRKSQQKSSNWGRLFSNIKEKQPTASKPAAEPKFKLSGIKFGGVRSPQGIEASDNWEKDKVKNPERFSDLHRVVFEKNFDAELMLESIARYHLHTTVYQCRQRYGLGSTDSILHQPVINSPDWSCPVLCNLKSRQSVKETAKSRRTGFLSTVRKTMLIRRMTDQSN